MNEASKGRSRTIQYERNIARAEGVRKKDTLLQRLRCPECGEEVSRRVEFIGSEFASIEDMERRALQAVGRTVKIACPSCGCNQLKGDGREHALLAYSEHLEAFVSVVLRLVHEDDGRTKVRRTIWWLPNDSSPVELRDNDTRLTQFWIESSVRAAVQHRDTHRSTDRIEEVSVQFADNAIAQRELGFVLLDVGRNGGALAALQRSLMIQPRQATVLPVVGLLLCGRGQPGEGADHLVDAYQLTNDPKLLPQLIRAAYQSRRLGLLERAADLLDKVSADTTLAGKARVAAACATDLQALRDGWVELRQRARTEGEQYTVQVADHWLAGLELPIPDWQPDWDLPTYRRRAIEDLQDCGYEVDASAPNLGIEGVARTIDLIVTDREGRRWALYLVDTRIMPHVEHTLVCAFRSLLLDAKHSDLLALPICRHPMTYALQRYASRCADVVFDLLADADGSMHAIDEMVGPLVVGFRKQFGIYLELETTSVEDIERVMERYHDGGFGSMRFGLRCQIAAFLGEVIRGEIPDIRWKPSSEDAMDPVVLAFPDELEINVITKVEKRVVNGPEDSLTYFVSVILGDEGEEA